MTVYVAEIAQRAIFAFDAANSQAAEERLADREFLGDLYVLQSNAQPLWDGKSEIHLREALPGEVEAWEAGRETASLSRVFLVPVVDPLKFVDPEDVDPYDDLDDDDDDFDDDRD
ncbi:hypothetical protein [Mesorhizobium sp. L-8-3]|uniref:hypothetical protein n=1 Tax=Mesorhizobium sp. L-8-3 TaxID=2744522 RepID=UPI0019288B55|nr:hypothetical protein [Mesorhizobium sp. L-8-3]BCH24803.1 hypothetical protein MesoLjLb_45880 [Mesorhizobium sp. L-8-3]